MRHYEATSRRRRFLFETMEPRFALAGDVSGAVMNGNLHLAGDEAGNALTITQAFDTNGRPISGSYNVSGNGDGTTINGQLTQTFTGVTGLIANLQGGNDRLIISNDSVTTVPTANPEPGSADPANVVWQGNVEVNLGTGDDYVGLDRVDIGGSFSASGSEGAKSILVMNTSVAGGLGVFTGDSNDMLAVVLTSVGGQVNLATGGGDDQLRLDRVSSSALAVDTGAGSDFAVLRSSHVSGSASLLAGDGNDEFILEQLNVTDALFASLGAGDDTFHIRGSTAAMASIAGESGTNEFLEDGAANFFGSLSLSGFDATSSERR